MGTAKDHLGLGGFRKMRITAKMITGSGKTKGCAACHGKTGAHSKECMERFEAKCRQAPPAIWRAA